MTSAGSQEGKNRTGEKYVNGAGKNTELSIKTTACGIGDKPNL